MFSQILKTIFGHGQLGSNNRADRLAMRLAGGLPAEGLPDARMLCVFAQDRLVNSYRDDTPPGRKAGEEWWLVPANDIPLSVAVIAGEHSLQTDVLVRFEPESELGGLLTGREFLTDEDVNSLVTSQIDGMLEMLGYRQSASLMELSDLDRERLRAKTSLLLQTRGLRCTRLGPFEVVVTLVDEPESVDSGKVNAASAPAADHGVSVAAAKVPVAAGAKSPAPNEPAFAELIGSVASADDWECLLAEMEEAGYHFHEREAGELYDLGTSVLNREIRAAQAAARMAQIAEAARRRAGTGSPERRRMRGLDIRLESIVKQSVGPASPGNASDLTGGPEVSVRRRPWTWWVFSHKAVDERLRHWLDQTVSVLRAGFDSYRSRVKVTSALVPLRRIDERLQMTMDLLATVATLTPPQSNLRLSRARIKELVRSVEGAVTAAETALAETRELQKLGPATGPWTDACDSTCTALDRLADQLRDRRAVR